MKYRYPLIKKILQSRKGFFDSNDTILSKRFKVNDGGTVKECNVRPADHSDGQRLPNQCITAHFPKMLPKQGYNNQPGNYYNNSYKKDNNGYAVHAMHILHPWSVRLFGISFFNV